jgi:hypothetical protein
MLRPIALFLLTCYLTGVVAAQPDKAAAMEKAKAKFEKDIEKMEETLLTGMDKSIVKALSANNKMLHEKLTYDRDQFVKYHMLPITYASETYHKQRNQAITALLTVYQPVINDLTKAKKFAELNAIEDELTSLLKSSRGYGLAFSSHLETNPMFMIENKSTGNVMSLLERQGQLTEIILAPKEKEGKKKQLQCWRVERYDENFAFRNVGNREVIALHRSGQNVGSNFGIESTVAGKDPRETALFLVTEMRRDIVIECGFSHMILTATEKKEKGVTTVYLTEEKKEKTPTDTQIWTLVEVK